MVTSAERCSAACIGTAHNIGNTCLNPYRLSDLDALVRGIASQEVAQRSHDPIPAAWSNVCCTVILQTSNQVGSELSDTMPPHQEADPDAKLRSLFSKLDAALKSQTGSLKKTLKLVESSKPAIVIVCMHDNAVCLTSAAA